MNFPRVGLKYRMILWKRVTEEMTVLFVDQNATSAVFSKLLLWKTLQFQENFCETFFNFSAKTYQLFKKVSYIDTFCPTLYFMLFLATHALIFEEGLLNALSQWGTSV